MHLLAVSFVSPDRSGKHFLLNEYFFLEQKKRPKEALFVLRKKRVYEKSWSE
jgi:hypothetical protein